MEQNKELTQAERHFWHDEAAREDIFREERQRQADEHREARDRALERLGMIRRIGGQATKKVVDYTKCEDLW